MKAAIAILDVDWAQTRADQRRTLIAQAMRAAGRTTARIPRTVQVVFDDAARKVVEATREAARRGQGLAISADFNALDRRIVHHLATSQAYAVRDEYGRRHQALSEQARRLVAESLEAGLGRAEMAQDLERAAQSILAGRSRFYWEVVAGAFVSQGRSFAQLSAYAEARIDRYVIEAVLDERTTEVCRFLHGKSFSVDQGLSLFERIEADPTSVKEHTPWVREAFDPTTGRKALYVPRGGERVGIAQVAQSALGTRDHRGEFARGRTERELADLGVSFPPFHGLCRTTTVAAVS
ncbi:MAG: head morphogenesis protein [Proteobacteria bacterium]|nr:head morphogenesis protein [Pseudomonadota bacterium]